MRTVRTGTVARGAQRDVVVAIKALRLHLEDFRCNGIVSKSTSPSNKKRRKKLTAKVEWKSLSDVAIRQPAQPSGGIWSARCRSHSSCLIFRVLVIDGYAQSPPPLGQQCRRARRTRLATQSTAPEIGWPASSLLDEASACV